MVSFAASLVVVGQVVTLFWACWMTRKLSSNPLRDLAAAGGILSLMLLVAAATFTRASGVTVYDSEDLLHAWMYILFVADLSTLHALYLLYKEQARAK